MSANPNVKTNKGKKNLPPPSRGIFDPITAPFERLEPRTKMMLKIGLGCFIGLWAVAMIVVVFHNLGNPDGPYIFDAMKAPYTLESRWQPPLPDLNTNVLPGKVGDFILDFNASQVDVPGSTFASTVNTPAGACLYSSIDGSASSNCTGYNAQYVASGDFKSADGETVNVVMALFPRHDDALGVMKTLLAEARSVSDVDKYVIGVTLVSYFNSAHGGLYNFYWSNGNWVYIGSSTSAPALGKLITDFPY